MFSVAKNFCIAVSLVFAIGATLSADSVIREIRWDDLARPLQQILEAHGLSGPTYRLHRQCPRTKPEAGPGRRARSPRLLHAAVGVVHEPAGDRTGAEREGVHRPAVDSS